MKKNNTQKIFKELIETMFNNWTYDPWIKTVDLNKALNDLKDEIIEFENEDNLNEKNKELGDIVWNCLNLLYVYSKETNQELEKPIEELIKKMKKRKPYIFEKTNVDLEEAKRIWKKVKEEEKSQSENYET
ncbi:MAG: MazG nucleotide pyrophosphohydrolase domain-containing protein [Candidatus Woesearchaeota archaeon]